MKKFLIGLMAVFFTCTVSFAQTLEASGKITSENGVSVSNGSVKEKGTKNGVSADASGFFKIKVKTGATLIVSAVGFGTKEVVAASDMEISLSATSKNLDEVVVTALGIKRSKNLLPYAAQQVTGEDVSKARGGNFVSALSGKLSGVEIRQGNSLGASTNVVVRGNKSLSFSNQALFVIDGMPFDNSNTNNSGQTGGQGGYDYGSAAADINPDDIESVTVLKGAASTALYGSRASNGVVVITTKKGKRGGLGVTVNSGFSFGKVDKSTFVKYQHQYGAGYGSVNGYGSPDGNFLYFDANKDGNPDLVTPTTEDASWGAKFDPNLMVYQWNAFDKTSQFFGKATPWVAAQNDPSTYFETATSLNNSVFIDGGDEKATFKLGYTRLNDKGILPNSQVNKDIVNFGATYKLSDKLTAGASINYTQTRGLGRYGSGYDAKNPMTNFRQWWQTNVDIKELKDAYFRTGKNTTWNWSDPSNIPGGLTPIYWDNPYWDRYENYETDGRSRYYGNINLNYNVTSWLNIMGRVALDSYDEYQEERLAIGSKSSAIGDIAGNDAPSSGYSLFNRRFREHNYDLLINFDKNLSKDLNLKALVGSNIRQTDVASILSVTNGGLVVPKLYALSNSVNPIGAPDERESRLEVDGFFMGATLTWKEMLTLDGTFRRDHSSTLPSANSRYNYPSISGGFIFSKLLDNAPWISYGKLRTNYAEVGNSAPAQRLKDTYNHDDNGTSSEGSNTSFGNATLFSVPSIKNNDKLVPEKTKSYELGLEMSFFNSRVGFDITYYNALSVNQIVPVAVSLATGYSRQYVNAGSVRNQGVELAFNATPIKTKNFSWNMGINWTKNRNKVESLYNDSKNLLIASYQGGVSINASLGEPYGTIRGSNFVYTNGEKTVKSNGFYAVTSAANEVIGNVNPNWIGGISNSFKYKGIALGFLIDVRQGGNVFSLDQYFGLATGVSAETAGLNDLGNPVRNSLANGGGIINPGVTADGKPNAKRVNISTLFGAYGYFRNPAAAFVYDASYVKLREVTLTYSLPKSALAKLGPIKGIDFSLVGKNLWIIHKNLPNADPEETATSGNAQGFQGGAYPSVRTMGFNVKFKF